MQIFEIDMIFQGNFEFDMILLCALGHYVWIFYIKVSIDTSISDSVSLNCHLISQKIISKLILVLMAVENFMSCVCLTRS